MKRKFMGKMTPVRILAMGFFTVIMIGTFLLMLPISSRSGQFTPFIDAFFTSTSATCVTGLVTVNTAEHWSYFGSTVIIFLIQIGGLGFMSFATLLALLLGKKITLRERLVLQEATNSFSLQGIVKLEKYILLFTFAVEGIGALFLSTKFIPEYGLGKGIYFSVFHSISAFCNAGFDLTGNSLIPYQNSPVIILTISFLIIIGGLGFSVWAEIYNFRGLKKLSVHSKIVITMTLILLICGTVLMYLFEMGNPETLQPMSFGSRLLNAFHSAVTPRTAGFNSISTVGMTLAGSFLTIILMFIGGSPGGTSGGIKTTTTAVLIMTVSSAFKNKAETEVFERTVSKELVYKAFVLSFISMMIVVFDTMILSITEVGASLEHIVYEVVSAFATVGITLGLTSELSTIGKVIIALTMYIGRVGPLTIVLALSRKKNGNLVKYPEGRILIG